MCIASQPEQQGMNQDISDADDDKTISVIYTRDDEFLRREWFRSLDKGMIVD